MSEADDADWKLLGDLLTERFGLVFEGFRRGFLASRLFPRIRALRLESVAEYYRYLVFHPDREAELDELRVLATNNETYFFREPHQFDILTRHIVPIIGAAGRRSLRILSAGCSSGEEAYSIGMALEDAHLRDWTWEIEGWDLNPKRIAQAREAVYEESSMRGCDALARQRWFDERDGRFGLKAPHRRWVAFSVENVVAPAGPGLGPRVPFDVVFCRNMLIYFSDRAFERAISLFARSLVPGGFLLLGHSESLIGRRRDFSPVCVEGGVIYRKVEVS